MKIKHTYKGKEKIYEYPTTQMVVNIKTRDKIKLYATQDGMSMKAFMEKLVENYENTSH